MLTENINWSKNLKAGDKVGIDYGSNRSPGVATVKNVTAKGAIRTTNGFLYRDGRLVSNWTYAVLVPWTQELEDTAKANIKKRAQIDSILTFKLSNLTATQIQKIYDIITK